MRTASKFLLVALSLALSAGAWSADLAAAKAAYKAGDFETAFAEWQALADEGYVEAQFGLGLLYANGYGVSLDDSLALKWYLLAAEQGHPQAQCNLAVMYANGWGVPQSDEQAFEWYLLAAESGVTAAQIAVANLYSSGYRIAENKLEARKWLAIAATLGDLDAPAKRDALDAYLSPEAIAESDRLAGAWLNSHEGMLAAAAGVDY